MLVLVALLSVWVQDVVGILGGCMSYSTTIESSGHFKVQIFFMNGWKIDKGPCPTCTAADKGTDVTQRRKLSIQQKHNQEMFGKWTAEVYNQKGTASYIDKTRTVNNVSTDVVLIVGEKEGWELICSEISIDFDLTAEEFDITLNSSLDVPMTLLPVLRHINLQVRVEPGIRNDTKRPNRSPVVLVKPLYSLEIGKIHTLHLTSVDNDGDAIRCENSEYVESSGLGSFVKNLTTQNLLSLNRMTCVMRINVSQSYFHENDTFGVAVTVKDYGTHPLSIQSTVLVPHFPYMNVIGRVVVLMYFKITGKTDPPIIISPTPRNNQEYTIYLGGEFHVDVYAKATVGRKIVRFDFLRRDGKPVNHTGIQNASHISDNAVFISTNWSPTKVDKGHHILCANAEDNKRTMTVDLHCFRIVVKENIFRPTTKETEKPYFVSFPDPTDLKCKKDTYCGFPVYATTSHAGGITSIISTSESKENVTIQYSRELINGTIDAKVAQIEFFASQAGSRQICLRASDSHAYSDRCLYVTVELPDPCASEPCLNLGSCHSFDNNTRYNCSCRNGFSGNFCEKRKKQCDPNPCLFNGTCLEVPLPPFFFCICVDDRKGELCDIDRCQANPCNDTQVCQTSGSDVCIPNPCASEPCQNLGSCHSFDNNARYNCSCRNGFSGNLCEKRNWPCHPNPCLFNGTCLEVALFPYFYCLCVDDRTGKLCDIDRCQANPCNDTQVCQTSGSDVCIPKNIFRPTTKETEKPYFVLFPEPTDLKCKKDTYCRFPVYATTTHAGGITSIMSTPESKENVTIQYRRELVIINGTIYAKEAQIEYFASQAGSRQICLRASDSHAYSDRCLYVTVELPDPCASEPCQNLGSCQSFDNNTRYNCSCRNGFSGNLCEKRNKPCDRNPCLFNGTCHDVQFHPYFFCICVDDRKGDICDIDRCQAHPCNTTQVCQTSGPDVCIPILPQHHPTLNTTTTNTTEMCKSSNKCRNDAACYSSNQTVTCICRLGFQGPNCSDGGILTSPLYIGTRFTDSALPKTVICFLSLPCHIPFTVIRNTYHIPTIVPGFITYSIKIRRIDLNSTELSGRIIHGNVDIIGSSLGLADVCLASVGKAGNVKTEDEICFEVKVLNGHNNDSKVFPHFLKTTYENNSTLQCLIGKDCHLELSAASERDCPDLKSDKNFDNGVFIIPPRNQSRSPCTYDVVFRKEKPGSINVCFTLKRNSSSPSNKRCYTVQFSSSLSVKGSCIKHTCCNGGLCDGHAPQRTCLCRVGFSGESCSSEFGIPQAINQNGLKYPLFGNMVLPKQLICPLNEDCHAQLLVSERNGYFVTTTTDPSSIEVTETKETPVSGDYLVTVKFVAKKTGSHQLCVNVSPDRYSHGTDKVCFNISTKTLDSDVGTCSDVSVDDCRDQRALINICSDPTTATYCRKSCKLCGDPSTSLHNMEQRLFVEPSPKNSSTFSCSPGLECHMLLYLKQSNNSQCPSVSVQPITRIMVHIFNNSDSYGCSVDILMNPSATLTGQRIDLCIQASHDESRLSEIRCYAVVYEESKSFQQTGCTGDNYDQTTAIKFHQLRKRFGEIMANKLWNLWITFQKLLN